VREWSRGQHQHVDGLSLAREREALMHAEAMLLVDDGSAGRKLDFVLNSACVADQQVELALFSLSRISARAGPRSRP